MNRFEWKWGLLIGGASLAWLLLAWGLGWHSSGIGLIQLAMGFPVILSFVGYFLAMFFLFRREPETTFPEGFRAGALIATMAAIVVVLGHFLYLRYLNPGFTDYMVEMTLRHFSNAGLTEEQLAEVAAGAAQTFGLRSFLVQAGAGALLQGVVFSAVAAGVMRWRAVR